MADDLNPDDVQAVTPRWDVMLRRGVRKHCPRCDHRPVFETWFRMHERCPRCGLQFAREEGFVVGVYFINLTIVEGLLFVLVMAFIAVLANDPEASLVPPLAVGGVLAVLAPIVAYPYARSIWTALDLAMRPLELDEILAARDHVNRGSDEAAGADLPDDARDEEQRGEAQQDHEERT